MCSTIRFGTASESKAAPQLLPSRVTVTVTVGDSEEPECRGRLGRLPVKTGEAEPVPGGPRRCSTQRSESAESSSSVAAPVPVTQPQRASGHSEVRTRAPEPDGSGRCDPAALPGTTRHYPF
jgi:hypothetical protein